MQKTRSWQDSFDRLETAQREERQAAAETRQTREAEAAHARSADAMAAKPASPGLMLVGAKPKSDKRPDKPKPAKAKTAPRKRATAQRTATQAKQAAAKPRAARKPRQVLPPAPAGPATQPAELLLITPLPRSAALTPYRKTGLFGLIGSWLRIATRQAATGVAGSVRRPKLQANPRPQIDELAKLRAENARLRRQLDALLSFQEMSAKAN